MLANKPYVIGLTGGIGCGKSEAARYLESLGAAHLDADEASRALTAENGEALDDIRRVFGDAVFRDDGTLDRTKLGKLPGMIIYVVKQGDNLWNIGKKYYVSVERLRTLNGLSSDELKPGQKLLVVRGS